MERTITRTITEAHVLVLCVNKEKESMETVQLCLSGCVNANNVNDSAFIEKTVRHLLNKEIYTFVSIKDITVTTAKYKMSEHDFIKNATKETK